MKALRFSEFGGPEKLMLVETQLRKPAVDEIAVEVAYAGVNHVDRLVIGGRLKWISLPHTPGAEYVGRVASTGSDVKNVSPGDRVAIHPKIFCGRCKYCMRGEHGVCLMSWNPLQAPVDLSTYMLPAPIDGGWAEQAIIYARNAVKIPDSVGFREAACLPLSAMTAHHMIGRVSPSEGEEALVMGAAGGIGLFAAQLLRLRGCTVHGAVRNEDQADRIGSMFDSVVVIKEGTKEIDSPNGKGFDIVVDPLGESTFNLSVASLAPCGRYVTCGTLTGNEGSMNLMRLYSRQLVLTGSTTGSPADLAAVLRLMGAGSLKPVHSTSFRLEEAQAALGELQKRGRVGKVLLEVNASL